MARRRRVTLTHLDDHGRAAMVDVGAKPVVARRAVAEAVFRAKPTTIDLLLKPGAALPKGDALAAARLAGILAAKRCDELVPLCHTLPLDRVAVEFERPARGAIRVVATASTTARTGVEMEAIVAATIAAITLYDMTKAVDRNLRIEGVRLVEKTKAAPSEAAPATRAKRRRAAPRGRTRG